jgi:NAD(P)-dependent dehydrogenase (short-subunit alcohol dehydrogenase family)
MTTRFSGRTALVTGAGSGIGRTTALAFAAEGAQVVVAGRTAASLDETVALIEARGGKALAVTTDVSRSDEVHALVEAAVDRFGSLDVAVNNAAVFHGGTPLADLPEADWHAELDINVTGVFLALQAEIRQMRTQPSGGAIVNHIADGVRINVVSPGASATTMSLRPGESEAERVERARHELPLGRVSKTEEVAAAVLYLASDDAASVVGTDLVVDSGGVL